MTEHTEKDVLMKCTKCGYEEEVPRWLIDELFPNEPEENYMEYIKLDRDKSIFKSHRDFSSEIEITFKHL